MRIVLYSFGLSFFVLFAYSQVTVTRNKQIITISAKGDRITLSSLDGVNFLEIGGLKSTKDKKWFEIPERSEDIGIMLTTTDKRKYVVSWTDISHGDGVVR